MREVTRHTQRIQKTLEDANIKLSSVLSDILVASGRAILDAIVAGESDPERLADLARKLKAPREKLVECLRGHVTDHHRFILSLHLNHIDSLNAAIATLHGRLSKAIEPFRHAEELLTTIPGVGHTVASVILGEIGVDLTRFPTAGHLISWAGLCPGQDESAGKRRSNRLRKGAPWLKTTLVQAAWAAVSKKDTYLRAQYYRIKARRGAKKAIVAVAASMLKSAYFMLQKDESYVELGPHHFDERHKAKLVRRLLRRLEGLGCKVTTEDSEAA